MDDATDPATEPEQEYVELQDKEFADPGAPDTFPDGATVQADRRDAAADHKPDRPPTADEAAAAPEQVDPAVAAAYKEAAERGASVKGEGAI